MYIKLRFILLYSTIAFFTQLSAQKQINYGSNSDASFYVSTGEVDLYCEIYGTGAPLIVLHGGMGSISDLRFNIPALSKKYKVIAIDYRGHGRSTDAGNFHAYDQMANDIRILITKMNLDSVYIFGWSDGGILALHLAATETKIKKIAVFGANASLDGLIPSVIESAKNMSPASKNSFIQQYKKTNPQVSNADNFVIKTREMWLRDPYIEMDKLQQITIPVLIAGGDHDIVKIDHLIKMYKMIGKKAQLCIIPSARHSVIQERSSIVNKIIIEFFN